jgi:hypothetical protein
MNTVCDLEHVRTHRDTFAATDPQAIARAAREAADLARAAYADHDARDRAERVLYALHADNGFAAPLDPPLAAVWSVFGRPGTLRTCAALTSHTVNPAASSR